MLFVVCPECMTGEEQWMTADGDACRRHNWPGGGYCPACYQEDAEFAAQLNAGEAVWDGLARILGAKWMRDHVGGPNPSKS